MDRVSLVFVWTTVLALAVSQVRVVLGAKRHLAFELIKKRVHGRRLTGQFIETASITREADDVYFTHVRIGGKDGEQQTFSVILDTGSGTIAVPCSDCSGNCGPHNAYDKSKSSTCSDTGQRYYQSYGEGSTNSGHLYRDNICFGANCPTSEAVQHPFGCCNKYSPNFKSQGADGIIGISHSNSLIKEFYTHHDLENYEFALCLGRKNGVFSVGGYDDSRHISDVAWTPVRYQGSFYDVTLKGFAVGQEDLPLPSTLKTPFFDSGTSYTYVPSNVFVSMKSSFDRFCKKPGKCVHKGIEFPPGTDRYDVTNALGCFKKLTDEEKDTFPGITLTFANGVSLCASARAYFFDYPNKPITCVGITKDGSFTIGANLMVDHNIIFDVENSRLGIAVAKCDGETSNIGIAQCYGNLTKSPEGGEPKRNDGEKTPGGNPAVNWIHVFYIVSVILMLLSFLIWWTRTKRCPFANCCCRSKYGKFQDDENVNLTRKESVNADAEDSSLGGAASWGLELPEIAAKFKDAEGGKGDAASPLKYKDDVESSTDKQRLAVV